MISSLPQSPVFNQANIIIDDLKSFYKFGRENDVVKFLASNPHLLSILALGQDLISQYLLESYVFLECVLDPEFAQSQLVVYVTRRIEDTGLAMAQIEKLYDEWLGGYNSDIRSQIYIRYDYV